MLVCVVVAGCGGIVTPSGSTAPSLPTASAASPGRSNASGGPPPGSSPEPWRTAVLTDVRTGVETHLADLAGKIVFVEGVATWCPPCLEQQLEARAALAVLDPARVVWVSLDVDPSEDATTLLRYAQSHDFPWTFAVATPELLRYLATRFGDRVLAPPDTPVIVLAPDGTATLTEHGIKHADRIIELARARGA